MKDAVIEGYFPPKELARQFGLTERTLSRWHKLRIGPPRIKVGKKVLYRVESVQAWLTSNERQQVRSTRRHDR